MLFSIITITKNNPHGFTKTEASLRKQRCVDYEWIVIDGDIEPDEGIYDAMNKGIERASGDYLLFMNAGDTFAHCRVLNDIAITIGNTRPDFIYGDAYEETTQGPALKTAHNHRNISFGMITHHQAMLYHREALYGLRYDTNYKIAADYKFTVQFILGAKECRYISIPVCCFESGGVSQRRSTQGRNEQAAIRKELGICNDFQNWLIGSKQFCASTLKKRLPRVYWHLRKTSRA